MNVCAAGSLFWGTGMMVEYFRQGGGVAFAKDGLDILVKIAVTRSPQTFSTLSGMPLSCPFFLGLTVLNMSLMLTHQHRGANSSGQDSAEM